MQNVVPSCNQMSIIQSMSGLFEIMRDKTNMQIKKFMFHFLIKHVDYTNDLLWDLANSSLTIVLCWMVQGEIAW